MTSQSILHRLFALAASLGLAVALTAGCGSQQPAHMDADRPRTSNTVLVHLGAKALVKRIADALPTSPLALTIDSVQDGTILTGYKEYEGAIHIVRRWRERTRFRISVLPDFNDGLNVSHVEVLDETEEKPSDWQDWGRNPELRRPERSDEVAAFIATLK